MSSCATNKPVNMSKRCLLCERKIFNKVPKCIVDFVENKKQFIGKQKNFLLGQSFYSINEFLNCSYEP